MRYLALNWSVVPSAEPLARKITETAIRQLGMHKILETKSLIVLVASDTPAVTILPNRALVVGSLFTKDDNCCRVREFGVSDAVKIVASDGQSLVTDYWGGYVAFIAGQEAAETHVIRDPSGAVPCYRALSGDLNIFFSDIEVPLKLGLIERRLDWAFVAHHLTYYALRPVRTGLVGVEELLAGSRINLASSTTSVHSCWTPWIFARRKNQIEDYDQAVELVKATTRRCIEAWSSCWPKILLELSGGLDSSIIAAALEGRSDVTAVTMVTPDPGADERRYAKLVSDKFGFLLREAHLSPDQAVLSQYPHHLHPRPGIGALQQVVDKVMSEQAIELGTDCFFSGGGGDNVFCYLNSAAPAADVLKTHGMGKHFFRAISDLSNLHGCTVWKAGRLAIRKARTSLPWPWKHQRDLLRHEAYPFFQDDHHWLMPPDDALPGRFEHIISLIRAQIIADIAERSRLGAICCPLLSQPVMELCLRIPTWMWILEGRNRAIARDAFAGSLPAEVLNRRTKGNFTRFSAEIYNSNIRFLRPLLLDGLLMSNGIIDRDAVENQLSSPIGSRDLSFDRLLDIAGVEIWARGWLADGASIHK